MAIKNKRKSRVQKARRHRPIFGRYECSCQIRHSRPRFSRHPLGRLGGQNQEVHRANRFNTYLIEWNQSTLDNRHPIFQKRCDRDGLEDDSTWLDEENLEADDGET